MTGALTNLVEGRGDSDGCSHHVRGTDAFLAGPEA